MDKQFFHEQQRFSKTWLVVIAFDILFCGAILLIVFNNSSDDLTPIWVSLLVVLLSGFIVWIIAFSKLETIIDTTGVRYRFPVLWPSWKIIQKEEIVSYKIRTYDAFYEFGGWGMRNSKKKGRALIMQGDKGLQLELKTGEQVLIGTQNKESIEWAMNRLMMPIETE